MKKLLLLTIFTLAVSVAFTQTKAKETSTEKPLTQKEMLKAAQKEIETMSAEDKKIMEEMGIKIPDMNNVGKSVSGVSDAQLQKAYEDESRIVPERDEARIAAIPKGLTDARMGAYITSIQNKTVALVTPAIASMGNEDYSYIKSNSNNSREAGNMAVGYWVAGEPELALYLLGRICADDPNNKGNISNYASMLSMQGGQHLAIPILNNLNAKFPKNSTLLNNLGQAWFGLGEMDKAERYLDSAISIYAYHPQANLTKSFIQESKGNKPEAIVSVKRAIKNSYSKEKENRLRKLGITLKYGDLRLPFKPEADPLGLNSFRRPDYPKSASESKWLKVQWDDFLQDCKQKITQLEKQKSEVEKQYEASLKQMTDQLSQAAMTGRNIPSFVQEPLYATKASLVLNERKEFYEIKFKELGEKFAASVNDLDKIQKERKRCAPEAPCTCFRDADNEYLRSYNERKQIFDEEALTLFKHFSNDMAFWSQYTSTDETQYELIKLEFIIGWLQKLSEYRPIFTDREYECIEEEQAKPFKLAEWDFTTNCKYNFEFDYGIIDQQINCGHTTTTYNLNGNKYEVRELGTKFIGSTLILSPKISVGAEVGPLTIEAFVGADITIELDENKDVTDWNEMVTAGIETGVGVTKGPVKLGASVTNAVEVEIDGSGIKDVVLITAVKAEAGIEAPKSAGGTSADKNINRAVDVINKGIGAMGTSVKIGVEDHVSIFSGHGKLNGTGILEGVTISQWE